MARPVLDNSTAVPGYELLETIGVGGFGEVFRARHTVIGREVAIKILHARHCSDPAAVARFVTEARAVNKISHPNIVEISDFGELPDGRSYCVMELVEGTTLRALLSERGRIPLAEAVPLLGAIADAIDTVHAVGIAHRDLKPDNIFVLPNGSIKLIDFGLAKLTADDVSVTQTGQVFGTPLYMSPEQCRGRGITVATDLYSFGALAYHVLVGEPPFSGEPLDLALKHINDAPPRPSSRCADLPASVDAPLLALLAKDAALRPTRARDAVDALAGTARLALPGSNRRAAIVAASVVALGVAGGAVWLATREPQQSPPQPAWAPRMMRLDFDGVLASVSASVDGHIVYGDEAGWWRHDPATRQTTRLPIPDADLHSVSNVAVMSDGRLIVGRTTPPVVELVDPTTGATTRLLAGRQPAVSADERWIAAWTPDRALVVHEIATGRTRPLYTLSSGHIESPPCWSPDGTNIVWGGVSFDPPLAPNRTFVTRVADGSTVPLDVPYRSVTSDDYYAPIAFLPDGRIAYCRDKPAEVRARPLWGGPETTLASIDETVSECTLARRGNGLLVMLSSSQTTLGVMPLPFAVGQPTAFRQVAGPVKMRPVAADTGRVLAYINTSKGPANQQAPEVRAVDVTSGALTPVHACFGENRIVRRGDEMLHVVQRKVDGADVTQLLALDTCAVVDEWRFANVVRFGVPSCTSSWCAIATAHVGHVVVWKLEPGKPPVELGRVPRATTIATPHPIVAVSPDGRDIALALAEAASPAIYVFDRDAAPRSLSFAGDFIDGMVWDRERRLLVSGQGIDGATFALVAIALDGTRHSVWSSKATYLSTIFTDPDRTYLSGLVSTWHQELLLLEVTESGRPASASPRAP